MNRTPGNGDARAFSVATPPYWAAGKNFSVLMPRSSAAITSDGVTTPGSTSMPRSRARATTAALRPGLADEAAPAIGRLVDLLGPDHRAGTDHQPGVLGHPPDGLGRRGGAERDLRDMHTAGDQGVRQPLGAVGVGQDDDRDDAASEGLHHIGHETSFR